MSTRAQILAEIAAQFPDNTSGLITPAKLRQVVEDIANSYNNSTDEGTPAASITAHNDDAAAHLHIVTTTPSSKVTLTTADSPLQRIKPSGDIDVETPALGAAQWYFLICHGGTANRLTVKKPDSTVLAILIAGAAIRVSYDGTEVFLC